MGKDLFTMEGKTVVFTGGCGSLGRVMVKALLEYGAAVAVLGRRDRLDESYEEYRRNGRLSVIPTDLSKSEDTREGFRKAEEQFGSQDVRRSRRKKL